MQKIFNLINDLFIKPSQTVMEDRLTEHEHGRVEGLIFALFFLGIVFSQLLGRFFRFAPQAEPVYLPVITMALSMLLWLLLKLFLWVYSRVLWQRLSSGQRRQKSRKDLAASGRLIFILALMMLVVANIAASLLRLFLPLPAYLHAIIYAALTIAAALWPLHILLLMAKKRFGLMEKDLSLIRVLFLIQIGIMQIINYFILA